MARKAKVKTSFSIGHVHQPSVKRVGFTGGFTTVKYARSNSGIGISSLCVCVCVCVVFSRVHINTCSYVMQRCISTIMIAGEASRYCCYIDVIFCLLA